MIKISFPPRPKQRLLAFCDESSHNRERYFVLGAVYFVLTEGANSATEIANIERQLARIKSEYALVNRLKWERVPTQPGRYLEGYKEFIKSFFETDGVYFKCLVLDTHKYRLDNTERWAGDALIGYYKERSSNGKSQCQVGRATSFLLLHP